MSLVAVLLETFERLDRCNDPRKNGPVIQKLRKEIQRAIELSLLPNEVVLEPRPLGKSTNPPRRLEIVARRDVQ